MKKIRYSTQYRKDIKRFADKKELIDDLYEIVRMLEYEIPIPPEYRPHRLKGKLKGCWECHIRGNFLLIWMDEVTGEICLERLGSHSELFRM